MGSINQRGKPQYEDQGFNIDPRSRSFFRDVAITNGGSNAPIYGPNKSKNESNGRKMGKNGEKQNEQSGLLLLNKNNEIKMNESPWKINTKYGWIGIQKLKRKSRTTKK